MDKVILGDNQFFGVNHKSIEKSLSQAQRFTDPVSILKTLADAKDAGIHTFMCTTHDGLEPVFDMMRGDSEFNGFKVIPCMPYAHKYATAVTDLGILGGIQKYLPGNVFSAGVRGAKALVTSDYFEIMRFLIDSEMKMLSGLEVEAIFLQNIMTDLLLGLGMDDFFVEFHEYVRRKYKVETGFITMNYCMLVERIIEIGGLTDVHICSPINKIGFRMNPSQEAVEEMIKKGTSKTIAMSIFASGAIDPREAITYINSLSGIESVLFGASSRAHIQSTFDMLMQTGHY